MGLFGALSVFRRHIKGMIWLRPEQVWMSNVTHNVTAVRSSALLLNPGASVLKSGASL